MSDIDVHHLAAAYALDALDPHERHAFEAHYESCEVCRSDVLAFRDTMVHVAGSLAAPPPASLKDRVLADISVTRQLSPSLARPSSVDPAAHRHRRSVAVVMAAAAAMVLVVVGVVALTGRHDDGYADGVAHLLDQPDVEMVDLASTTGGAGSFRVMWSPSLRQAALIGEDLPAVPADKAYELWLITPDQTMAMNVLDPAPDGNVHRVFPAPADPSGWAVTVEPRAGSPVATGDIIYLAEVSPAT